jgi:Protein of unknown function (DUF2793)
VVFYTQQPTNEENMATTQNLEIALLEQFQSQKEITINEGFAALDIFASLQMLDYNINTPPATPNAGDAYILGSLPTGSWGGKAGKIAYYFNSSWFFITPKNNMCFRVKSLNSFLQYNGTGWEIADNFRLIPIPSGRTLVQADNRTILKATAAMTLTLDSTNILVNTDIGLLHTGTITIALAAGNTLVGTTTALAGTNKLRYIKYLGGGQWHITP